MVFGVGVPLGRNSEAFSNSPWNVGPQHSAFRFPAKKYRARRRAKKACTPHTQRVTFVLHGKPNMLRVVGTRRTTTPMACARLHEDLSSKCTGLQAFSGWFPREETTGCPISGNFQYGLGPNGEAKNPEGAQFGAHLFWRQKPLAVSIEGSVVQKPQNPH